MLKPYCLSETLERALSAESAQAEKGGTLTAAQLEIINREGWFRMFVPADAGGLQTPLPEALHIEEALARIDGSLGWTVTLCSGAGLFAGFVQPSLLATMFADPALCVGGSGAPGGIAERVPGGYRVSGDWHFATGAPHLTAFSTNCRILESGVPVLEADGNDMVRSFLFYPHEVSWRENWPVYGLKATASHSFSIDDLVVPDDRCFHIRPDAARLADPVYRYPFLQFAELTLAANFGGLGLAFIDAFEKGLGGKSANNLKRTVQTEALQTAKVRLEGLRSAFHLTAAASWNELCSTGAVAENRLLQISADSRALSSGVRRLVAELYPFGGIAAANPEARINRIWRDLFTATQHALLTYPTASPEA